MVDVNLQDVIRSLGLRVAQLTVDLALKEAEVKALQAALNGTLEGPEESTTHSDLCRCEDCR